MDTTEQWLIVHALRNIASREKTGEDTWKFQRMRKQSSSVEV
jgi:hypothetical protein